MDLDKNGSDTRRAVPGDAYVDAALRSSVTVAELQEIATSARAYCGFPAAVDAFRTKAEVIDAP